MFGNYCKSFFFIHDVHFNRTLAELRHLSTETRKSSNKSYYRKKGHHQTMNIVSLKCILRHSLERNPEFPQQNCINWENEALKTMRSFLQYEPNAKEHLHKVKAVAFPTVSVRPCLVCKYRYCGF